MKNRVFRTSLITILILPIVSFVFTSHQVQAATATWGIIGSSLGEKDFTDIAVSSDGKYMAATVWMDSVYTSINYGATWTERSDIGVAGWDGVTISDDGSKIAVVDNPGKVHTSTDGGETWTESSSLNMRHWGWIDGSADGNTLIVGADASGSMGAVAVSTDAGSTWETLNTGDYNYVAVSADGTHLAYNDQSEGAIMLSSDGGDTWNSARSSVATVNGLDLSAQGERIVVIEGSEAKVSETDAFSWTTSYVANPVFDVAMDASGQNIVAAGSGDYGIHTSEDYGETWEPGEMTDGLDLRAAASNGSGERVFATGAQRIWTNSGIPDFEDVNGDTLPDEDQPNVGGYISNYSNKMVGIDVGEDCELTVDDSVDEDFIGVNDPAYVFESGLFEYEAECAVGATTTITLYYYDTNSTNKSLRKFMPRINGYFNLGSEHGATIEERTINGSNVTVASFQITDGSELDDDQIVDGMIIDPVGLAEEIISAPNTGLKPI